MAKLAYGLLMIILAICCTTAWAKQEGKMQGGAYSPCDMCRFLVGYVEDLVGQKQSVADIVTVCSAMCGLAPREMAAACRGFVSAYVPFLVQYLIDTENPGTAAHHLSILPELMCRIQPLFRHNHLTRCFGLCSCRLLVCWRVSCG
jgi:hypothetical protein